MATIDIGLINIQLSKDDTGALKKAATVRAKEVFYDAVLHMRQEFEEDLVTKEIDGGISSPNLSETLGGGEAPNNLTSFIGISEGDQSPLAPVREIISPKNGARPDGVHPSISEGLKVSVNGKAPRFEFVIKGPNQDRVWESTPLPWAPGMSWAEKIETGIPGFAHFLNRYTSTPNSRSGGGLQVENEIRPGQDYAPPAKGYLQRIFRDFIELVDAYNRKGLKQTFKAPGGGYLSQGDNPAI